MNLFAYGTLMDKDIMLKVAGCLPDCGPARLQGFKRMCVRGKAYPGIIPSNSCAVDGLLYRDVPSFAWQNLDDYEGIIYKRQLVEVTTHENLRSEAYVYVIRKAFYHLLEDKPWSGTDIFTMER